MRIATFNCNSIRMRLPAILSWLKENAPDALALQETKTQDKTFPEAEIVDQGWHVVYRGEKSYNGVAVITKAKPDSFSFGLGDDAGESETRLARVRIGKVEIINTYVPQGRELASEMFQFKLQWLARLRKYLDTHFKAGSDRVCWVGDLNVAPTPADVYDSKAVWPHVCHCQEVIDAFAAVCEFGLTDVFRKYLPNAGVFTFWDYRGRDSLNRNIGWRIDHILATKKLADTATGCQVDVEPRRREKPSDHTFVYADFSV